MPPRTPKPADPAPAEVEQAEPPYYEATQDLFVGHPEAGVMPQLAYRAGDRVAPDVVEPNGWGGGVRVPPQFEGQLAPPPPPPPEPEATAPASPDSAATGGT
jgi:hypothetical protein